MGLYPLFWSALEVGRGHFRLGRCEGYIDMEGDDRVGNFASVEAIWDT